MHHEFEFQLDEHGEYVATYRQPAAQPQQQRAREAPEQRTAPKAKSPKARPQSARAVAKPRTQTRRAAPAEPQPRPLTWLLRVIADIYDSRFVVSATPAALRPHDRSKGGVGAKGAGV